MFDTLGFWFWRRQGEPQIMPGSLLWGSANDYSRDAVAFLHRAQRHLGDIFTIRLVNQYLTIVMDPHCYDSLSLEKNFDFDPIQKQVGPMIINAIRLHSAGKSVLANLCSVCFRRQHAVQTNRQWNLPNMCVGLRYVSSQRNASCSSAKPSSLETETAFRREHFKRQTDDKLTLC